MTRIYYKRNMNVIVERQLGDAHTSFVSSISVFHFCDSKSQSDHRWIWHSSWMDYSCSTSKRKASNSRHGVFVLKSNDRHCSGEQSHPLITYVVFLFSLFLSLCPVHRAVGSVRSHSPVRQSNRVEWDSGLDCDARGDFDWAPSVPAAFHLQYFHALDEHVDWHSEDRPEVGLMKRRMNITRTKNCFTYQDLPSFQLND